MAAYIKEGSRMASMDVVTLLRELAASERSAWDAISNGIPGWHPRNEGDGDADADGADSKGKTGDPDKGTGAARDDVEADGADGDKPDDWKGHARRHEREAKKARKEAEDLRAALAEREAADQTEQERAVAAARDEGKAEARSAYEKERRADRLDSAVTRLAARGVTVGDGDDAKRLRFDDPEDALVFVERGIARGDIDEDDVFDSDGKVQVDGLTRVLVALLKEKPRLAATDGNGNGSPAPRPTGDADAGKGASASDTPADMNTLIRRRTR